MPVNVLVTRGKGASRPDWARIMTFETYDEAMAYCDRIEPKVKEKYWEMGTIMPATGSAPLTWPDVCNE